MVTILDRDAKPTNSIYYIGGIMIDYLAKYHAETSIDFFDFHNRLCKLHIISIHQYIFALDWLYLLELIETDSKGNIKKCF